MNPSSSLHDYRLAYPRTAAVPTLTQSGLLRLALKREQAKAARIEERMARRSRFLAALTRGPGALLRAMRESYTGRCQALRNA